MSIVARARTTLEFNTRRPAQFSQLYESPPAVTWLTVYRWIEVCIHPDSEVKTNVSK